MQIAVTFNSFEEMKDFTELVMVGCKPEDGVASRPAPVQVPVQAPQPVQQPATPATPVQTQQSVQQSTPVQMPQPAQRPAAPATPVQTTQKQYTPDELAIAAMALMDSGRQQELVGLLQQFGVAAIPALRPEQYGPFATALRGMGAAI